jgi:mitochondrial inner membrane protease subunit 1
LAAAYPASRLTSEGRWGLLALAAVVVGAGSVRRVEVAGDSMRPALLPGDRLVVWRWGRLRDGDMLALRDPRTGQLIVKRLHNRSAGGALSVAGDNSDHSTDSRHFGPVDHSHVVGRVVYRYSPPDRAGWIAGPGTRW